MDIQDLIESYERKVKALVEIQQNKKEQSEIARLDVKLGCYRAFLFDLRQAAGMNQYGLGAEDMVQDITYPSGD